MKYSVNLFSFRELSSLCNVSHVMIIKRKKSGWTNNKIIEYYRPELLNQQKTDEKLKILDKKSKRLIKKWNFYEYEQWTIDKEHSDFCRKMINQTLCLLKELKDEQIIENFIKLSSEEKDMKVLFEKMKKYKKEHYL